MRTLKCDSCASSDFEKISDHEYRCRYCGSIKILEQGIEHAKSTRPVARMPEKQHITALVVIIVLMSLALWMVISRNDTPPRHYTPIAKSFKDAKPSPPAKFGPGNISVPSHPKASFENVTAIPDRIGNYYFAGLYKNTGTSPIRTPMVAITLFSQEGKKVAQGRGYSIRKVLLPKEETPVLVLITRPPQWSRFEAMYLPELPYAHTLYERPALKFRNCALKRGQYVGYEIHGEIVNNSDKPVKHVRVIAAILNKSNSVIGAAQRYVPAITIAPNDYSPININVTSVKGEPYSFILDYEAQF